MKIYFAGTTLIREREMFLIKLFCKRLFSFYYHRKDGMAYKDFKIWKDKYFR